MKKIFSFCLICLFTSVFLINTLFAQSWSKSVEGDKVYLTNTTGLKVSLEASAPSQISSDDVTKLGTILDTICSIPNFVPASAMVYINQGAQSGSVPQYRLVLVPSAITYKGEDLSGFLPSGLAFYYDSSLFYDITVKAGTKLPRVTGAYISPDDMLSQIKYASLNPDNYMYDTYVLRRLERLESAVMAVSKKGIFSKASLVEQSVIDKILSAYNENPGSSKAEISDILKNKGEKISSADLDAVFMVYLGLFE